MFRHTRKLTAWLGLVAIWLAVLAPLISQLHTRAAYLDAPLCSTLPTHADYAHYVDDQQNKHALHLNACEYCGLLAHCPFMVSLPPSELPTVWRWKADAARYSVVAARSPIRYLRAYGRAPPLLV